jgi:hypothetical protein
MESTGYPLHIQRSLDAAEAACAEANTGCHDAVLRLADALVYYLGAVAVAQYTQALYAEQIEADPTLNRSLRSLRRLLPGQWLGWIARGLEVVPNGLVDGLAEWYTKEQGSAVAGAYTTLRNLMVAHLAYTGEYGPRESASPRHLLELIDQYRVRRGKVAPDALPGNFDARVSDALLLGLHAILESAGFLEEYQLYAPGQRQLLVGAKPVTPMPPISAPADVPASILFYPPGEAPDYTKRPDLQAERVPIFPLDPLLAYLHCPQCDRYRVAALQEVVQDRPAYMGLDPECGHKIIPVLALT